MEYAGVGSYGTNLACCIFPYTALPFIHITRAMIASKYGMKETDKWIAINACCCPGGPCQARPLHAGSVTGGGRCRAARYRACSMSR